MFRGDLLSDATLVPKPDNSKMAFGGGILTSLRGLFQFAALLKTDSGHPSTDYVSQEIVFVKHFERDTGRLRLGVQCPSVRGR